MSCCQSSALSNLSVPSCHVCHLNTSRSFPRTTRRVLTTSPPSLPASRCSSTSSGVNNKFIGEIAASFLRCTRSVSERLGLS